MQDKDADTDFDNFVDELLAKIDARRDRPKAGRLKTIALTLWGLKSYLAPLLAIAWIFALIDFVSEAVPCLGLASAEEESRSQAAWHSVLQRYRETFYPFAHWHFDLLKVNPTAWMPPYILAIYFSIGAAARNAAYEISPLSRHGAQGVVGSVKRFITAEWTDRVQLLGTTLRAICHALVFPVYLLIFAVTYPVRRPIARWISRHHRSFEQAHRDLRKRALTNFTRIRDDPNIPEHLKSDQMREAVKNLPFDPADLTVRPYFDSLFEVALASMAFISVLVGMSLALTITVFIGTLCDIG